jgi:predicted TIM-barrel fold metal-dependent hydrolase
MPDYKLISADSHVNETPQAWEYAQKKHGDKAPHVVWNPSETEVGPYLVIEGWGSSLEGRNMENCANEYIGMIIGGNGIGSQLGRTSPQAQEFRKNFRFEDWKEAWDPQARLNAQDRDGVEAEVLYASHLRHFYEMSATNEPLFRDVCESYNQWLMDFHDYDSKRYIVLPVVSVLNPHGAAEDIRRYAKRGVRGFMMGSSVPQDMSYGDPFFDPIWEAAVDCDVSMAMHTTTGKFKRHKYAFPPAQNFDAGQMEIQASLAEMVYGGLFDRFPTLKIVSAEFDIGWAAYVWQKNRTFDPRLGLKLSPAEYLQRNVWFTFQDDRAGCLTAPYFGKDKFLWSSDFPHGVCTWPDSPQIYDEQTEGLSEDIRRMIARQNTIDLYKLDLEPSPVK